MNRFNFKEKLLDRSDQTDSKGLAWVLVLILLLLMSAAVLYFNDVNSSPDSLASTAKPASRPARLYSVFYSGGVFSPTNLRIHAGDTVRFQNTSPAPMGVISDPHPAHNNLMGLNSAGQILPQGFFAYTFADPGIYGYHNELNPNQTGVIIVR